MPCFLVNLVQPSQGGGVQQHKTLPFLTHLLFSFFAFRGVSVDITNSRDKMKESTVTLSSKFISKFRA